MASPRSADSRAEIGQAKEQLARQFLETQGLRLVEKNYRCRLGEVDLIMQHRDVLAFVEVRFRRSSTHGAAGETVTRTKQARIARAAAHYLQQLHHTPPCRFDVVSIGEGDRIEWIADAFRLEA